MQTMHRLLLGPLLAIGVGIACSAADLAQPAVLTAALTAWCAAWWVTEAIPIPATSLIPFVGFPAFGLLSPKDLAGAYGHPLILLLLGGFLLSSAMESSGAHRGVALSLLRAIGNRSEKQLVLAFMICSAALSMWISNTATTLMLLPVALAVIAQHGARPELAKSLLLGIAYAASIGGLGTPIGTPPNVIFMGVYREHSGQELSFLQWMAIGIPATVTLLPVAWLVLTKRLRGVGADIPIERVRWTRGQRRVLWVFALTAALWMTRKEPFGGWAAWLPQSTADDGTVALGAALLLFVLPNGEGGRMLDWEQTRRLPWGLMLLFAGGIAIAKAFDASGLSQTIGYGLAGFASLPKVVMIGLLCLLVTFLTEVTSNTAITTLLMPILAAAAAAAGQDARLMMVPAALSASCAFMLPVATVPNAIVFGTEHITITDMSRAGLKLNLLGTCALTLLCTVLL